MNPLAFTIIVQVWPDLRSETITNELGMISNKEYSYYFFTLLLHQALLYYQLSQLSWIDQTANLLPKNIKSCSLTFYSYQLTPRSKRRYIGLEKPSAWRLTAADSLLSAFPIFKSCFSLRLYIVVHLPTETNKSLASPILLHFPSVKPEKQKRGKSYYWKI